MERREDIRAAMQSLLSPVRRPESRRRARALAEDAADADVPGGLTLSPLQLRVLREIQAELRDNGILTEPAEIIQAMIEALATRPSLCRALLAAYLLDM